MRLLLKTLVLRECSLNCPGIAVEESPCTRMSCSIASGILLELLAVQNGRYSKGLLKTAQGRPKGASFQISVPFRSRLCCNQTINDSSVMHEITSSEDKHKMHQTPSTTASI